MYAMIVFQCSTGGFFPQRHGSGRKWGCAKVRHARLQILMPFFRQALRDTLLAEPAPSPLQRVDAVVGYLVGSLGLRHPTVAVKTLHFAAKNAS